MGFLARLFPGLLGPEARMRTARNALATGDFHSARLEMAGVEHPDADALREEIRVGMLAANLIEAEGRFNAGDADGAKEHLELARQLGATTAQLAEVRSSARRSRPRKAPPPPAAPPPPEGEDPLWSLPPDDPRVRYAMLLEGWPDDLRERLLALGAEYAEAIIRLEQGDAEGAWGSLRAHVAVDPVARYDRARAAIAIGRLRDAASELRLFGEAVGHRRIGGNHTAVMLAECLARSNDLPAALIAVEGQMAKTPGELDLLHTRASVLEGLGRLDDAEAATTSLLERAGKSMPAWRLLARIRLRKEDRPGAAAALEAGLGACCNNPGKCGNQPLDVEATRALARLYLEDRVAPDRVVELLDKLQRAVKDHGWEDNYLVALVARNRGEARGESMARRLVDELGPTDPRAAVVISAFPALAAPA